jgi:hypothetical protein
VGGFGGGGEDVGEEEIAYATLDYVSVFHIDSIEAA